jgi:hypothetical protein
VTLLYIVLRRLRALPAWIWPPRHLYDGPARMRASLSTGLMAWSFLIGLGLVFAQLTQFQGYKLGRRSTEPPKTRCIVFLSAAPKKPTQGRRR